MLGSKSDTLAWEIIQFPKGPLDSAKSIGQIQVADGLYLFLGEENDPSSTNQGGTGRTAFSGGPTPKVRNFFAVNLNTMECWRIKNEVDISPNLLQRPSPYQMVLEGKDILVCSLFSKENSNLIIWRLSFSRDYKTLTNVVEKTCAHSMGRGTRLVLHKEKLYFFNIDQKAVTKKPQRTEFGLGQDILNTLEKYKDETYIEEKLAVLDLNNMEYKELQTQGPKPIPRLSYSTVFYKNQLYLFGGASFHKQTFNLTIFLSDVWALDLDSLTWKELTPELTPPRRDITSVILVEDKVYMFGGQTEEAPRKFKMTLDLHVYDISTNSWESIPTDNTVLPQTGFFGIQLNFHKGKLLTGFPGGEYYSLTLGGYHTGQQGGSYNRRDDSISKSQDRTLFAERPFPDITFKVEQKEIPAHRAILYAGSTFFRDMLTSGKTESSKSVVEIPDMKAAVFEALLEYIYCGTVEVSEDIAWEVLQEADKHSLPGLKTICEDYQASCIKVENVVQTINMAEKYGANSLRTAAMKFVVKNRDRVFEEADIYMIKKSTLLEIYKMQ